MPVALWFSRLQPGVTPADYERFVRAVDYPATKRIPSLARYRSLRVHGPVFGDEALAYDFIDLAEITGIAAYRRDLESHPAVMEVHGQFEKYVQSMGNFWADLVGEAERGEPPLPQIVWFSRLQPGVVPAVYEQWVREVDYPGARQISSLISYRVFRVNGPIVGESAAPFDYDYVEWAAITNRDDYLQDLDKHPAAQAIIAEIGQYVRSVGSAWGTLVEP